MGEKLYRLRFPFRLAHAIAGFDSPLTFRVDALSISLRRVPPGIVAEAAPFASQEDAAAFIPRLWGALAWFSITQRTGFFAETMLDKITYANDPVEAGDNLRKQFGVPESGPVHGLGDGSSPAIYGTDDVIRFIQGGDATFSLSIGKENLAVALKHGLNSTCPVDSLRDERLRTAIDLYCASHRETSVRAKFLTYVMALEVLSEPEPKHPVAVSFLKDFETRLRDAMSTFDTASEESHALESLRREVVFRQGTALRSRVRRLIQRSLTSLAPESLAQSCRDALRVYDVRSELLHNGTVDASALSDAFQKAQDLLLEILAIRLGVRGDRPDAGA